MIALSVAKLKMFSLESEIFLWIKPKTKNKIVKSLEQCPRLEVREKARNVFLWWASTSIWSQGFTQHCIFKFFFDIARIFSPFSLVFRTSNFWSFKEFNKTIISSAFVGYDNGYSQLGDTRLVGYLPPHIQRALME